MTRGYRERKKARSTANPKAPDINVLARHHQGCGLSKLPDMSKHVADAGDVGKALRDSGIDPAKAEAFRKLLR
jgi:hypothetical protein